jgi:hypothetical protein
MLFRQSPKPSKKTTISATMGKPESRSAETDTLAPTTNTEPTFSRGIPVSDDFKTLNVANAGFYNMLISYPHAETPLFYVRNAYFGKSSVKLTAEEKNGPVLGVVKLACFGQDTIGIGDPDHGESEVVFEELRKTSKWTHGRYEFEYTMGIGERKTFVWTRTKTPFFADQPDLELREKLGKNSGGEDELGEVLAVYQGCQGVMTTMRGTFFIRKDVDVGPVHEKGWAKEREWSDWELIVLLSACGIIEAARRRARARRSNGAS